MSIPRATPDFALYTAGMEALPYAYDLSQTALASLPSPQVAMLGSSTEKDLHGDIMELSALNDMTNVPANLALWLNHTYTVPDSFFATLASPPELRKKGGIADIRLVGNVELLSDAARKTYTLIQRGARLGCSIGCQVTQYDIDGAGIIHILHLEVVEWSVVGVPANQRCWVENAIKGVFTRTLDERLVPAMKSLSPGSFNHVLKTLVTDEDQRDHLSSIPARTASTTRLFWLPDRDTYELITESGKTSLTAKDLSATLGYTTKEVTGNTDWPIADPDTVWEGSQATQRLRTWAGESDISAFDPVKLASVHFAVDSTDPTSLGSYQYPFCDMTPNGIAAIPHALFSIQTALASETALPATDIAAIRTKVQQYLDKIPPAAKEFIPMTTAQELLLKQYNELGNALGFAPVTPDAPQDTAARTATLKSTVAEMQAQLTTLLSAFDETSADADSPIALTRSLVDAVLTAKSGKTLSDDTMASIQAAHHTLCAMTNGKVCKNAISAGMVPGMKKDDGDTTTDDGDGDTTTDDGDGDTTTDDDGDTTTDGMRSKKSLRPLAKKAPVTPVAAALDAQVVLAQKHLAELQAGIKATQKTLQTLQETPLGRPTEIEGRALPTDNGPVPVFSVDGAIAQTTIKRIDGIGLCRIWGKGVGVGFRPPLTTDQMTLMSPDMIVEYTEGGAAAVPQID